VPDTSKSGAAATSSCQLKRNDTAQIVAVDGDVAAVLGWDADDLVGQGSTSFVHPQDQASAVAAWIEMLAEPRSVRIWRGRYRDRDGTWRWVETANENRLDDPSEAVVVSTIARITVEEVNVEEELRAREELLSRLADALPVGIFQFNADVVITFTNDRLHAILRRPAAATMPALFDSLHDDDVTRLDQAVETAMNNAPVDDLELRVSVPTDQDIETRVCQISLRPLTDATGAVTGAIGCLTDVTDAARLRRELEIRATVDPLTGCLNRSAILELLELLLGRPNDTDTGIAALFVDLDDFKSINDQYGHAAGDAVLTETARRLRAAMRGDDQVGRIGGDEFLALCPDLPNQEEAKLIAERLRRSLVGSIFVDDQEIPFRATLGVAWNAPDTTADALIAAADTAMYHAKARRQHLPQSTS